ncbi:hypothetical protein E2C01_090728 [Portunus trituberculatus]|uniref:Uncharacterized protein n=1 Tax=Portunus trituberculatus TaxID=210409 RepID=A0A5B7JHD7_PORTR|nr:hypothetical protein [Portunus trituberculatus]
MTRFIFSFTFISTQCRCYPPHSFPQPAIPRRLAFRFLSPLNFTSVSTAISPLSLSPPWRPLNKAPTSTPPSGIS